MTSAVRARVVAATLLLSACGTTRLYPGPPHDPKEVARVFAAVPTSGRCESTWLKQIDGVDTRQLLDVPDIFELEPGEHRLLYRVSYSETGPQMAPQPYWVNGVYQTQWVEKCGQMYAYEIDLTVTLRAGNTYVPAVEMKGGPGPFEYQRLCLTGEPHERAHEHGELTGPAREPGPEAQTLLCERGVFADKWVD